MTGRDREIAAANLAALEAIEARPVEVVEAARTPAGVEALRQARDFHLGRAAGGGRSRDRNLRRARAVADFAAAVGVPLPAADEPPAAGAKGRRRRRQPRPVAVEVVGADGAVLRRSTAGVEVVGADAEGLAARVSMTVEAVEVVDAAGAAVPRPELCRLALRTLADVRIDADGRSVLAALADLLPRRASTRRDPILPTVARPAGGWPDMAPLRQAGLPDLPGPVPVPALPLFPSARLAPQTAALLEVVDATGAPTMARGRGAPLEVRLLIGGILAVDPDRRAGPRPEPVHVRGREILRAMFPGGWSRRSASGRRDDWARVLAALGRVDGYRIPLDGLAIGWRPVEVRQAPADPDDDVVLVVWLPPGTGAGPVIDRETLHRAGARSAPAYRGYIGVHTLAFRPAGTRIPPARPGAPWTWAGDPTRYPVLTPADRARMLFGPAAGGQRRSPAKVDAAMRAVPGVEVIDVEAKDREDRRGWRVVPAAAAEAVRRWRARRR